MNLLNNIQPLTDKELKSIIISLNNKIYDLEKKGKEEKMKLEKKIEENKDTIGSLNIKIEENKDTISNLNIKIEHLEKNQLLLFHQISMYQTSRDISKSINYYFYEYLNLRQVNTNGFEKLKAILNYIEEKDEDKLKKLKSRGAIDIPGDLKQKLANYFRVHFFVNKVSNKIVHRNFTEEQKRILEEKKENDFMPLIPSFEFDQCFDSLEYFIENSVKNEQVKAAMEFVYDEKYSKDEALMSIKESSKETYEEYQNGIKERVIYKDENGVNIKIDKSDLEQVRNYFKNISIDKESFVDLCNNKIWDQEEFQKDKNIIAIQKNY